MGYYSLLGSKAEGFGGAFCRAGGARSDVVVVMHVYGYIYIYQHHHHHHHHQSWSDSVRSLLGSAVNPLICVEEALVSPQSYPTPRPEPVFLRAAKKPILGPRRAH